ncbi:MAG: Hsp70 family protein, partial [Gammaproteobacteria bacterium]|nr:Hsp70 family protein [Gammaproteobacteria bacterium]
EQKIVIKASSGLSEDEIKRMVNEAESHAEEDRQFRELVDARNQADGLVHTTERMLRELGDKVDPAERGPIESALSDAREAIKGDDKAKIELKAKALAEVSAVLAQKASAQAGSGSDEGAGAGSAGSSQDGVVDAEFEEIKDGKDQSGTA